MSDSRKILVVNDSSATYYRPFSHLGLERSRDHELIDKPEEVALVVFTGGEDVSPELYGKSQHPQTMNSIGRDEEEVKIFEKAQAAHIPVAGICRGAQFLCVMAGGKLVQDITGHGGHHPVFARMPGGNIEEIIFNSTHHQMQYPFDLPREEFELLAWGREARSRHYAFDKETVIPADKATHLLKTEPDVVWYPRIQGLAAQYHPEWMMEETPAFKYFQALVDTYLRPLIEKKTYAIQRKGESADQALS